MWLHLPPSVSSPSSPASADSTSESRSPSPELALWLTLSGKPTQRPISWRGWKNRPWMRLLSGTTLPPSTVARGVESWIASLAASPALTSLPPGSRKGSSAATAPVSGLSSHESLAKWDPTTSLWKTSQLSLFPTEGLTPFSGRFPTSGTMRNGSLWQRPTWVPPIKGSASSSWPTARAEDSESCGNHSGPRTHKGDSLTGVTKDWRTQNTRDHHAQGPRENAAQRQTTLVDQTTKWHTPNAEERSGSETQTSLRRDVKDWQTPTVGNFGTRGNERVDEGGLKTQAKDWPTPLAHDMMARGNSGSERHKSPHDLPNSVENWPTPRTITGGGESAERKKELGREEAGGGDLQAAVQKWTTPKARDWKGGEGAVDRHEPDLDKQSEKWIRSLRVPVISTDGVELSPTAPTTSGRRRLNPGFVCWLMGWPWWWTRAERISFAAREMESWLYRQRSLLRNLFGG